MTDAGSRLSVLVVLALVALATGCTVVGDPYVEKFDGAKLTLDLVEIDYDTHIAPLMEAKCAQCHGTSAGLDLDPMPGMIPSAGASGATVITPCDPSNSSLYTRVCTGAGCQGGMPPGNPLSPEEQHAIEQWINEGAAPTFMSGGCP